MANAGALKAAGFDNPDIALALAADVSRQRRKWHSGGREFDPHRSTSHPSILERRPEGRRSLLCTRM